MNGHRDIVVIGASAGGNRAIAQLTSGLHPNLAASVMIVLHVSPAARIDSFPSSLCGPSTLPCSAAEGRGPVRSSHIYVAPPDRHLRVIEVRGETWMQVDRGPRENRTRPSIDALFRSAAAACGPRVVGVLLTGLLDDGVAGLAAIQRAGGRIVIQDPVDAEAAELPRRALETVSVDACIPISDMAGVIGDLVGERVDRELHRIPGDLRREAVLAARAGEMWPDLDDIGERTPVGCPACGGPLWVVRAGESDEHLRCHIGHGFTPLALMEEQDVEVERALHYAIRVMEEKARSLQSLARSAGGTGTGTGGRFAEEATRAEEEAETLRRLILGHYRRE